MRGITRKRSAESVGDDDRCKRVKVFDAHQVAPNCSALEAEVSHDDDGEDSMSDIMQRLLDEDDDASTSPASTSKGHSDSEAIDTTASRSMHEERDGTNIAISGDDCESNSDSETYSNTPHRTRATSFRPITTDSSNLRRESSQIYSEVLQAHGEASQTHDSIVPSSNDGSNSKTPRTTHKQDKMISRSKQGAGAKVTKKKKKSRAVVELSEEKKRLAEARQRQAQVTEGVPEARPPPKTYQPESDELLAENDPYFAKGCGYRMVFVSDAIPEEQQFAGPTANGTSWSALRNAADKFFDWCGARVKRDRPGHFVLKMGPPNGPHGQPTYLANRLRSLHKQFLNIRRFQGCHITIETEIPYCTLSTTTEYFHAYQDALLDLLKPEGLGDRLNVILAEKPTKALWTLDTKTLHLVKLDKDVEWKRRFSRPKEFHRWVLAHNFVTASLDDREVPLPTEEQMELARKISDAHVEKDNSRGDSIDAAFAVTKSFLAQVLGRTVMESVPSPAAAADEVDVNLAFEEQGGSSLEESTVDLDEDDLEILDHIPAPFLIREQASGAPAITPPTELSAMYYEPSREFLEDADVLLYAEDGYTGPTFGPVCQHEGAGTALVEDQQSGITDAIEQDPSSQYPLTPQDDDLWITGARALCKPDPPQLAIEGNATEEDMQQTSHSGGLLSEAWILSLHPWMQETAQYCHKCKPLTEADLDEDYATWKLLSYEMCGTTSMARWHDMFADAEDGNLILRQNMT